MTILETVQSLQNDNAEDFTNMTHEEKFDACMTQFIKGCLWKSPKLLEKIKSKAGLNKHEITKITKFRDDFFKYVMQRLSGSA